MRKKKEEELKLKIKKEILKELQQEEKKNKDEKIVKPVKPPVLHHSQEELQEIRKNFLIIFLMSIAILFVIVVILIVDPFSKTSNSNEVSDEPIIKEEEKKVTLTEREDGIIERTNEEMLKLFFWLKPNNLEYYVYDSTYLYSKDEFLINDVSNSYLLYLISKSSEFKEIIEEFGLTKIELCNNDSPLRISAEEVNQIAYKMFNRNIVKYEDFIYTHYVEGAYSTYIKFVYSDGYYVAFCEDKRDLSYTSIAMPVFKEAVKEKEEIKIRVKVAFSTKNAVYADYGLTTVISDNPNDDILNYINNADEYEFVFKIKDNNYYLSKIAKVVREN